MTKKGRILLFICLCIGMAISYILNERNSLSTEKKSSVTQIVSEKKHDPSVLKREVAGRPQKAPSNPLPNQSLLFPSENWKKQVERNLRQQGGSSLKDLTITKLDSYPLIHEGIQLQVAAVAINLTNQKGESTSFNAVVDSQNGKILRTWNPPVFDPINPRLAPGIKIDHRYHQE